MKTFSSWRSPEEGDEYDQATVSFESPVKQPHIYT
jgi:hypothetical protein